MNSQKERKTATGKLRKKNNKKQRVNDTACENHHQRLLYISFRIDII
jgi:hypothetical protein